MSLHHHTLVKCSARLFVSLSCLAVRVSVVLRSGMDWDPVRRDVAFLAAALDLRPFVGLLAVLRFPLPASIYKFPDDTFFSGKS